MLVNGDRISGLFHLLTDRGLIGAENHLFEKEDPLSNLHDFRVR